MTRKDYMLIAETLARCRVVPSDRNYMDRLDTWQSACREIAYALAADNSRFDRDRFLKACGVLS